MNEYPFPGYRFTVSLDPADARLPADQAQYVPELPEGGFQEVTGLGAELEVFEYREGGRNDFVHKLPVAHSWTNIVLRRGLVEDDRLWRWYEAGLHQSLGARRDGSIALQTPDGQVVYEWHFLGGIAVKWKGPDLNALEGAVALEEIEIAHHGVVQVRVGGGAS